MHLSKSVFYILILLIIISCTDKEHRKQQFLLKGNEAFKNQNFNLAINYYEEAIKTDSCYSPALNNLATIYYKQDKLDQALHLYENAVDCDPEFYQAYINLSNTLFDLKQYYRGLTILYSQLKNYPDSTDLLIGMGLHLTKLRDYDSAESVFNRAYRAEQENEEILVNLGTINYYQQDLKEAQDQLKKAIELNPKEAEAYNTLALVAAEEGDFKNALDYIHNAIEIDDRAHFLNNKGYILIKLDQLDEAREIINESIVRDPWNGWAFRNKAIIKLKENNPEEAVELLHHAGKLEDWIENLNFFLGEAHRQMGEMAKACEYYKKGYLLKEKNAVLTIEKFCKEGS